MADPVYNAVVAAARVGFRALGVSFDVTGAEHVPRSGGAVLAINHVGYLDFTFAGYAAHPAGRLVRFMAKREVFDHPAGGPLMRAMKHIPVDREGAPEQSYLAAVSALRTGQIVGVFPEATISTSFELKTFKSGAARLAIEAGVPLLPCVVWGSQRILTKNRPRDLTRGTPVRIVLGEPMPVRAGDHPTAVTAELKARMGELLATARDTYAGTPRSPADTWWIPATSGGTAPTLEQAERAQAEQDRERAVRRAERDSGSRPPR